MNKCSTLMHVHTSSKTSNNTDMWVRIVTWTLDESKYHPLRVIGKSFASKRRCSHVKTEAIFTRLFSRNHRFFNKDCAAHSFEELCQPLPGFVEVTEQPETERSYQTMNGNSLKTFVWACVWNTVLNDAQTTVNLFIIS